MKKSLLILSMMAVAASASAYDAPVAGTAAAPNYYVIKANRGTYPYLAYGLAKGAGPLSYLTRTQNLTDTNIWEITPGTAEGTVVIKNYTTDSYLMDFHDDEDEVSYAQNATAVTVKKAVDLVLQEMEGAYAISLNVVREENQYITLDAPGGTADYCGNWIPTTPASGEGGCFWFYKVDLTNGVEAGLAAVTKAIEDEANAAALEAAKAAFNNMRDLYVNTCKIYQETVPQVSDIIGAGIAALEALEYTEDYEAKINEIWGNTFNQANEAVKTVFNGKQYAIKNVRRVTTATEGAYLTVGDGKYVGATTYASEKSVFTFTSTSDGGYTIYNADTKTWIGAAGTPVATEAEAQAYYPHINSYYDKNSDITYYGLMFPNGPESANGLNWQSWNDGIFGIYLTADAGSVWTLVDYDPQSAVDELAATYEAKYQKYIENVPQVKEILEKAIADIKALTFGPTMGDEAAAIDTKAMEDANAHLATCFADKTVTLKNSRQNIYVGTSETGFTREENAGVKAAAFAFKTVEGGYTAYNAAAGKYIGKEGEYDTATYETGKNDINLTDEVQAITLLPTLAQIGEYTGVVLNIVGQTNMALNMNGFPNLWYYNANDAGAIFTIADFVEETNSIDEIKAAPAVREGIYDLQGRRLAAPVKGINIINGKKVWVK